MEAQGSWNVGSHSSEAEADRVCVQGASRRGQRLQLETAQTRGRLEAIDLVCIQTDLPGEHVQGTAQLALLHAQSNLLTAREAVLETHTHNTFKCFNPRKCKATYIFQPTESPTACCLSLRPFFPDHISIQPLAPIKHGPTRYKLMPSLPSPLLMGQKPICHPCSKFHMPVFKAPTLLSPFQLLPWRFLRSYFV